MHIIQIGSHVGDTPNDPIFKLIDETTKLILVEPVPYLFQQLESNYNNKLKDTSNVIFINKAVSNYIGETELTISSEKNDFTKLPFWASQLSSVNRDHATGHIPHLITEQITVPTTTLNQIINDYNITEIDLLHTDTEGHDYYIIMDYKFTIKPKRITFEHKHMDGLLTVGEKYRELTNRLVWLGYKMTYQDTEDTTFDLTC